MTMRIMIVEDQHIILEGIRAMISAEMPEAIITVDSADKAIELLRSSPVPDVIITDIVMPGKDGLSFIGEVKDTIPFCRFIILSGYDRFQFAQQAIHLGVTDYILKPIDRRKLIDTLTTIKKDILTKNRELSDEIMSDFRQAQRMSHGIVPHLSPFRAVRGCTTAFFAVRDQDPNIEENIPCGRQIGDDGIVKLYYTVLPNEICADRVRAIRALASGYGDNSDRDMTAAFLACVDSDADRFDVCSAPADPSKNAVDLEALDNAVLSSENNSFHIHAAISGIMLSLSDIRASSVYIRSVVKAITDKAGISGSFDVENEWYTAPSYDAFLTSIQKAVSARFGYAEDPSVSKRIRRYIDTHISGALSVKKVADGINMSPNYVSALFKRETGETLNSYIRKRQLETAYYLIAETDMLIYEVAEMLGYADEQYFSKLFRSQYGILPTDLRKKSN